MSKFDDLAAKNGTRIDEPSQAERVEAQAYYTAVMTDTLIEEVDDDALTDV